MYRDQFCDTCNQLSIQSHYYSFQTKTCYEIKEIYSCNTTGAIYLLDCNYCGKQYIRETGTSIRARMTHNQNASKAILNRPIYSHLKKQNSRFNSFTITITDHSNSSEGTINTAAGTGSAQPYVSCTRD